MGLNVLKRPHGEKDILRCLVESLPSSLLALPDLLSASCDLRSRELQRMALRGRSADQDARRPRSCSKPEFCAASYSSAVGSFRTYPYATICSSASFCRFRVSCCGQWMASAQQEMQKRARSGGRVCPSRCVPGSRPAAWMA